MERKTVTCLRKQNNEDKKRVKVRDEGSRDRREQRAVERERDGGRIRWRQTTAHLRRNPEATIN